MVMVFGKYDGFPNLIAPLYFNAVSHQNFQNLVDGILIKKPLIYGRSVNGCWHISRFIPKGFLIAQLFFRIKLIVEDSPANKSQIVLFSLVWNQVFLINSFVQFVVERRRSLFFIKDPVSIVVCTILGCCCQPQHECIKIFKNSSIFLVNGSMRFINNNQIKMSY